MKYYIIIGLLLAVFALLWFTRNVNAQMKDARPINVSQTWSLSMEGNSSCFKVDQLKDKELTIGEKISYNENVVCAKIR